MKKPLTTFIIDAFTSRAFEGNPAGVCLSDDSLDEERMQLIASELNLSETAFLVRGESDGEYSIRYFSPKMEIPLCGHATLASAKVVFELHPIEDVCFHTAGRLELPVTKRGDRIEMEFPVYGLQPAEAPPRLLAALGIREYEYAAYNRETKILMLEIASAESLRSLRPDFMALLNSHDSINGVLVTAAGHDQFDFHSRYFWPWSGTNEDPVTGGTHTFLAPYWGSKLGKKTMRSFQCSRRKGQMEVELLANDRMYIRGEAVVVLRGEIDCLPA